MKPVSNGAKAVFAVAFALFLAVVLVGIALSDNPVKKFFKQQEVLDIAKMHMSQVKVARSIRARCNSQMTSTSTTSRSAR